jgi:O-antigen ligase
LSILILSVFVLLLGVAVVAAVRKPALAVTLGIGTYGLEQIAAVILPVFRIHQSAFNIMIALVIVAAFVNNLFGGLKAYQQRETFDVFLLVYAYLTLFWVSVYWSPDHDIDRVWPLLPYFLVYVLMLPLLVRPPEEMIRAFGVLWGLFLVGFLGLALSPMLLFSAAIGRVVVAAGGDTDSGSNPLAFADAASYLALTSLMLIFCVGKTWNPAPRARQALKVALVGGVILGFSMALISSRGETMACLVSGILLVVLLRVKRPSGAMRKVVAGMLTGASVIVLLFFTFRGDIAKWAPRFDIDQLSTGVSVRRDIQAACVEFSWRSPRAIVLGLGGSTCEQRVGLYPHNELLQAFLETGVFGFVLFLSCYLFVVRLGLRTLAEAKSANSSEAVVITAFALALLTYELLVDSKKGSLTFPDSYMWLGLIAMMCDRAKSSLHSRPSVAQPLAVAPAS